MLLILLIIENNSFRRVWQLY